MNAIARKTPPENVFAIPKAYWLSENFLNFCGARPERRETKNITKMNTIFRLVVA